MKKLIGIVFTLAILVSTMAVAQDTTVKDDGRLYPGKGYWDDKIAADNAARKGHEKDWTTGNTIFALTFFALTFVDLQQTLHASENNWNQPSGYKTLTGRRTDGTTYQYTVVSSYYKEANPFLGKRPSRGKIIGAVVLANVLVDGIAYAMPYFAPDGCRELFQAAMCLVEFSVVMQNHNNGLKMNLAWKQGF